MEGTAEESGLSRPEDSAPLVETTCLSTVSGRVTYLTSTRLRERDPGRCAGRVRSRILPRPPSRSVRLLAGPPTNTRTTFPDEPPPSRFVRLDLSRSCSPASPPPALPSAPRLFNFPFNFLQSRAGGWKAGLLSVCASGSTVRCGADLLREFANSN